MSRQARLILASVDQAAPTAAPASSGVASATVLTTSALTSSAGDLVVLAATAENDGQYAVNSGFAERFETVGQSWGDAIAGSQKSTGASVVPSVTQSLQSLVASIIAVGNATTKQGSSARGSGASQILR